jgi:TolB protein
VRDLDTGETRIIESGPGDAAFPRWSPDGRRIAFVSRRETRWEVCVTTPEGGVPRVLTAGSCGLRGMDGPVDWSPDGRRIVFHADTAPFEASLFTVELDTGRLERLTEGPWFDESPSWTPDGRGILFMSTRGRDWTWGLFRLDLEERSLRAAVHPDWVEKNQPRLADDGTMIWCTIDEKGHEVLAERAPGRAVSIVKAAGSGARWPSFAGDRDHVLFTSVDRRVEYWIAETPLNAPELQEPHGDPPARSAPLEGRRDPVSDVLTRRSPIDLHRR